MRPERAQEIVFTEQILPGAKGFQIQIVHRDEAQLLQIGLIDAPAALLVVPQQVMQILRKLAGYSLGRADIVRRAMSKKKHDVMEKERRIFIEGLTDDSGKVIVEGCLRRGVDRATAISIYDEMESFASYAFNKSHATAYAKISYQTAYLKCHYPREYMAALMSSVLDRQSKLAVYISECHSMGIRVLPPDVNTSLYGFTVSGRDIRYGLLAIKNLGRQFIDAIISQRKLGPYTSFYDFCKRVYGPSMNSRAIESLIKCGALDSLGLNRRQMLMGLPDVMSDLDFEKKKNMSGQLSFFDMAGESVPSSQPRIPDVAEFSKDELLFMENEVSGMYLSGHPIDEFSDYIRAVGCDSIGDILNNEDKTYKDRDSVHLVCIVTKVKNQITKNNLMMAFVTVEDKFGLIECIVFPNVFVKCGAHLSEGSVVEIFGNISSREDEEPKIIANEIRPVDKNAVPQSPPKSAPVKKDKPVRLYLRLDNVESEKYRRAFQVLDIFEGNTPVVFRLTDTNKTLMAPRTMWVSLNDVMIDELKRRLGEENVVIS